MYQVNRLVRDNGWKLGTGAAVLLCAVALWLTPQLAEKTRANGLNGPEPLPDKSKRFAPATLEAPAAAAHRAGGTLTTSPTLTGVATSAVQQDARPLVHPVDIEDPGGRSLLRFHQALKQLMDGKRDKVRLAFFGASHVASDLFTDVVRQRLQERFGDGGPGFLLPAKPRRFHRHSRAEYKESGCFAGQQVRVNKAGVDRYGLAGVALDAPRKKRCQAVMRTRAPQGQQNRISDLTLYYLRQPRGGHMRVQVDGTARGRISTRASRKTLGYHPLHVDPGEHLLQLNTLGDGPVRIFGVSLENEQPGVVVDTLGVPGARARYQLQWHQETFRKHLQRRDPALLVLAYGTNEAGDDDVPLAEYESQLRRVLRRARNTTPNAACLLIGPSDQPIRNVEAGTLTDRPRTMDLIRIQRRVAIQQGCGFFDLVAIMGGPMTMPQWVNAEPALGAPDHIHFTRVGYAQVGEILAEALLNGYQ